jgi:hypothetical protein
MPSENDLNRLFGVLLASLHGKLSLTNARIAVARAGIVGVNTGGQYWDPFLRAVDLEYHQLSERQKEQTLRALADQLVDDQVRGDMARLGYDFVDGAFVPVEQYDRREAEFVPPSSASELAKAMTRLSGGDESGAITAACGAVDVLTGSIYVREGWGDPGHAAFAAKIGTVASRLNIFGEIKADLVGLGVPEAEAVKITEEWQKATNHAATMLQTLRSKMGDVHGTKATLRRAAYDAVKWSSAICGLLDTR